MIVLLAGILGGVFDPGGDAMAAACDRVFTLFVLPLLISASVSWGRPSILTAGPQRLDADCAGSTRQ